MSARLTDQDFELIFTKFRAQQLTLCRKILHDDVLAEDAFQEAYRLAWEHRDSFKGDNLPAWLWTILRNTSLAFLRRRNAHQFESLPKISIPSTIEQQIIHNEKIALLKSYFPKLRFDYQETLIFMLDDFVYGGDHLKSRRFRALRRS